MTYQFPLEHHIIVLVYEACLELAHQVHCGHPDHGGPIQEAVVHPSRDNTLGSSWTTIAMHSKALERTYQSLKCLLILCN